MATEWFYADAQNQQQGPVAASWLAQAYRSGTVKPETLVWRDGLSGWVPLRQVAAQLGIIIVGAAPPPLPAGSGPTRIVKPTSSSSSAVVVVVVLLLGGIVFLSILAAIALPAYQDYTIRAKIIVAVAAADPVKVAVAEAYEAEQKCPHNGEAGVGAAKDYATPTIASINVGPLKDSGKCGVIVVFKNLGPSDTDGKQIWYELQEDGSTWKSGSTLPSKFLPLSLRQSAR
ncbi:MAG TPA: GYF domain-containing protein [Rudaea sp.]|nr:GYF domain-containing protein [Rudaea sp.]